MLRHMPNHSHATASIYDICAAGVVQYFSGLQIFPMRAPVIISSIYMYNVGFFQTII